MPLALERGELLVFPPPGRGLLLTESSYCVGSWPCWVPAPEGAAVACPAAHSWEQCVFCCVHSCPCPQLLQHVIRGNRPIKTEMAHQLYVLQVLTFNLLEERMMTKMDPNDQVGKLQWGGKDSGRVGGFPWASQVVPPPQRGLTLALLASSLGAQSVGPRGGRTACWGRKTLPVSPLTHFLCSSGTERHHL